jgi:hypothetical protein
MSSSPRARVVLGVAVAALAGLLGLAGCAGRTADGASTDSSELAWDGQALEAIGFNTADLSAVGLAEQSAQPQASDRRDQRRGAGAFRRLRFGFGHGLLHGEGVIQTAEGVKTIVVQRGTVTEISSTSMTVKSADGFTLTWAISDQTRVIKDRKLAKPTDVAVGTEIGVSGSRETSGVIARMIVVPTVKPAS